MVLAEAHYCFVHIPFIERLIRLRAVSTPITFTLTCWPRRRTSLTEFTLRDDISDMCRSPLSFYADIDKGTESGDIADKPRKNHTLTKLVESRYLRHESITSIVDTRVTLPVYAARHYVGKGFSAGKSLGGKRVHVHAVECRAVSCKRSHIYALPAGRASTTA